jgi:alpha-glucosidase (family GH31 glycosyl hydrolase)
MHPFYLEMRNGSSHGVFMKNSNAMEVNIDSWPGKGTGSLTYRMMGGIIDLYIFVNPKPNLLIQDYHHVIGLPHMPPHWALGWHQCRWGYKTVDDLEKVVAGYAAAKIPLETMW